MQETTPDGLVTPDGGEEYALVAALSALAASVQQALIERANARSGTQTARVNSTSLPEGTLWKDTNGEKALYVLDSGQWRQLWPEPLSRVVYAGSKTVKLGVPFFNARWLTEDNKVYQYTIRPGTDPTITGISLLGFTGDNVDHAMHLHRDGGVLVYDGSTSRLLPFATATGSITSNVTGPGLVNTINIAFPAGRFTAAPVVNVTLATDVPQQYAHSVTNVTTSGFTLHVYRALAGSFNLGINWHAIQAAPVVTP